MNTQHWTKESLMQLVREKLAGKQFIVASNREPYVHTLNGDKVTWNRPVGGLTEALDPVLRASGGTWVAHGDGSADKISVDKNNRVAVPPDSPAYTLRRVFLSEADVNGFYLGYSNEGLWPLCHDVSVPPVFRESDWQAYQKVNRLFADAVIQEAGRRPAVVLVQDYHFALLSGYLAGKNPALTVGQFWHIPWPSYEVFRTCPQHKEILAGMLANRLLGFHIPAYCRAFLECAERSLGAVVDYQKMTAEHHGRLCHVQPFPISVDFDAINARAGEKTVLEKMAAITREYNLDGKTIGLGMDRLDYTKGIPERLVAFDKFLADNPSWRGKVVFIQAGMPSRTRLNTYRDTARRIVELTAAVNNRWGNDSYRPVIEINHQLTAAEMNALRRLARFCVVSALRDGMNLVGKEFAAARTDGDGVLILSRFAGAAEELKDALLIDPSDTAAFAGKIKEALEMPEKERRRRMANLRQTVSVNNIYRWGAEIVSRLIGLAEA